MEVVQDGQDVDLLGEVFSQGKGKDLGVHGLGLFYWEEMDAV